MRNSMKFSRNLFVQMGPDVPDSIRAQLLLNAINVEFEQGFVPVSQRTEPGYDDLYIWCVNNCTGLFTCFKNGNSFACFMFYEASDMNKFQQYLEFNTVELNK